MSVTLRQAYRFALDATPAQERAMLARAGAARVALNWTLSWVKAVMDQRAAEGTYGISHERLTPWLGWNLPAPRRAWNAAKPEVAPWWAECSKEAYHTGLDALARALGNWAASHRGERAARPVGLPRFRSKRRTTPSVRFTTGTIRVQPDRHQKAKLPLAARTLVCQACGMVRDRDLNAAYNLAQLVAAGSGPETVNGRGADRKTHPGGLLAVKRQPGTALTGKTGTVPPQGGTVDHELTHGY